LLLLDEPTRGLDYPSKDRLIVVLRELADAGHAIVMATHDVELAARVADRAVVLADGQIITDGPARQVVCHSPIFAPQVAKVLAPDEWLTVDEVALALREAGAMTLPISSPMPFGSTGRYRRSAGPPVVVPAPLDHALRLVAFGWPLMIQQHAGQNTAHSGDAPWIFVGTYPASPVHHHGRALRRGDRRQGGGAAGDPGCMLCRAPGGQPWHQRVRARMVPAHPGGAGLRPGLRIRPRRRSVLRLSLGHRRCGPWLPFQMLAAAWVGFGAGCLPPMKGFPERLLLAGYGVVSALVFGLLTNFWFWPFVGTGTRYPFVPGLGTLANLHRFILFDLVTSMGFDLTRAATCAVMILVLGKPVLAALRRASTASRLRARDRVCPLGRFNR
jgi:hypothetical protein